MLLEKSSNLDFIYDQCINAIHWLYNQLYLLCLLYNIIKQYKKSNCSCCEINVHCDNWVLEFWIGYLIYNTNKNLQSCFKCFWQKAKYV